MKCSILPIQLFDYDVVIVSSRPDLSLSGLLNPLRILKLALYNYRWWILQILLLVGFLLFLALFIYNFPEAFVKKVLQIM